MAKNRLLTIDVRDEGKVHLNCTEDEAAELWLPYFHLDADYGEYVRAIDPDDAFLTAAAEFSRGIRILRQEPFEMLITFILSQRKSIAGIMTGVDKLCACAGEPIADGLARAFPSPKALASLSMDELVACGLGYRAPYIKRTSEMVASGEVDLDRLSGLDEASLLDALMSFPGVGKKVASCVMLFGYHRLDAFPIDVWIERVINNRYGGSFDPAIYAGFAGIIQQYMFFYERALGGKG